VLPRIIISLWSRAGKIEQGGFAALIILRNNPSFYFSRPFPGPGSGRPPRLSAVPVWISAARTWGTTRMAAKRGLSARVSTATTTSLALPPAPRPRLPRLGAPAYSEDPGASATETDAFGRPFRHQTSFEIGGELRVLCCVLGSVWLNILTNYNMLNGAKALTGFPQFNGHHWGGRCAEF